MLRIRVKPKSGRFKIENNGDEIVVYVKSPPEKGKANGEIIKGIAKMVGISSSKVQIVSGQTSTTKVIRLEVPISQVKDRMG